MKTVEITPENAEEHSFFCIKNTKESGFYAKLDWFKKRQKEGLKVKVLYADDGKQVGFIEYVPAEQAWRPLMAPGYLFIHCLMVYPNKYRNMGAATQLINEVTGDAKKTGKKGVCTMTSQGTWMANKKLFAKNGFERVDKKGRFELMALKTKVNTTKPELLDWERQLSDYRGWHLLYADQCPWHEKGVKALINAATENGIKLKVKKIESAEEARQSPSGFGVFALIHDGKLLEDHYISKRRFETIIENEHNSQQV